MKVVLGSLFRDATSYFPRYLAQVHALRDLLVKRGDTLRGIWVEGDSRDDTWDALAQALSGTLPGRVVRHNHGGPKWGSVVDADRMRALGQVGNTLLANVDADAEIFVLVESDLIWDAPVIARLIDRCRESGQVIAPLITYADGRFYDVWAFRKDDVQFRHEYPYHDGLGLGSVVELDSAGSCLVMPGEAAQVARYGDDAIVDLCKSLRTHGYRIQLDQRFVVTHPWPSE